ncbi:helix-turn-helix transcriptional regulator [Salmonella enterica subsp. enterica serovar Pomona]|nr:helix-turn-helix transcriptional regulator [Salmonella enterica subsp. enterica serovar Pomona]
MAYEYDVVQKNIKYLMEKAGISSVTELSRKVKMQQSTLQRMLAGEIKDPKYITLKHIAEFFKISPVDLVECDLQAEKPRTVVDVDGDPYDFEFREVPVLGNTQLGNGGFWTDMQYPVGNGNGHIRWPSYDADVYALKCVGDSMVPRIKEGEFVIIEPNHGYHPGDEVLVVTEQGEVMVKTFLFERDGFYHLLPVNENHAPIRLPKSSVTKIQYIAGIAKSSLWRP